MSKAICLSTILTLIIAAGSVSIGYTTFVQTEIKEDISDIKNQDIIDREKITGLQVQVGAIDGKLDLLLGKLDVEQPAEVQPQIQEAGT